MARKRKPQTDPPDDLSHDDRQRLWQWAKPRGYSKKECRYAIEFVLDWARSNDEQKADWIATIRNGMRAQWALPPTTQARHPRRPQPGSRELPQQQGDRGEMATKKNRNVIPIGDFLQKEMDL